MLNAPAPPTVNCVVKLNPDDDPSPPSICASQVPPAAVCTGFEVVPQPFSMIANSTKIATCFMNECSLRRRFGPRTSISRTLHTIFPIQDYRDAGSPVNGCMPRVVVQFVLYTTLSS